MSTSRLDGLMRAANNRRSFDHVTFNELSPLARSQGQLNAVAGMAGQTLKATRLPCWKRYHLIYFFSCNPALSPWR